MTDPPHRENNRRLRGRAEIEPSCFISRHVSTNRVSGICVSNSRFFEQSRFEQSRWVQVGYLPKENCGFEPVDPRAFCVAGEANGASA
jgi:hypothetical protein